MVGVEKQDSLRFIKRLVQKAPVHMDLWENDRGDLFISLPTSDEQGTVFVGITPEDIILFFENRIDLRQLVERCVSPFVRLIENSVHRLLYFPDAELEVAGAEYFYKDLQ
jgi:hypothetical protein